MGAVLAAYPTMMRNSRIGMDSKTQRRGNYREMSHTRISTVLIKLPETTPITASRLMQKQTRAPDN